MTQSSSTYITVVDIYRAKCNVVGRPGDGLQINKIENGGKKLDT